MPQLKLALFWLSVAIALLSVLANSWDLRNLLDLLPGLHRGSPFDDHGRF